MHLKKMLSPRNKSGKRHLYYGLVQSERDANGKPHHRYLISAGPLEDFTPEEIRLIGRRVTELIRNPGSPFPIDNPRVEAKAQELVQSLIDKRRQEAQQREHASEAAEQAERGKKPRVVRILLTEVTTQRSRSVGGEYALLETYRLLRIDQTLARLGFSRRQRELAALVIIGRAMGSGSERSTIRWAQRESALGELLNSGFERLSAKGVYRIGDRLLQVKDALELALRERERDVFGLTETLILYDLTNTYFEGTAQANPKAKRGHSKEKRHDRPLLTLGLIVDGDGFVKASRLFPGNQSEPATLLEMIHALEVGAVRSKGVKPTVVIDAGIATEENLALLREHGYHYIAVSRKRFPVPEEEETLVELRSSPNRVEATVIQRGEDEVVLYCHSEGREAKERAIRKLKQERFEEELRALSEGLKRKQTTKRVDRIHERIGRFRERYASVAPFYEIKVEEQDGKAIAVHFHLRDEERFESRFAGNYFLRTTHTDWDEEKLWTTYKLLTQIEDVFRTVKGDTGLRPNFHQREDRVDAHAFISVLAFHLIQALQFQLRQKGIQHRWATIRRILSTQRRVTVRLPQENGQPIYVRSSTEPTEEQIWLYRSLGLKTKPLKTVIFHV